MKNISIILFFALFVGGCDNTPIFTDMVTNNLKVVIKGTYETDGISNFDSMPSADDPLMEDDSVDDNPRSEVDEVPTKLMLDIAEMRLGGKKISNMRQIFEFSLNDSEDFFNGTGLILKNYDPPEKKYDSVQIYIRKMIFDNAKIYQASGTGYTFSENSRVIFHEKDVDGFDFNQVQVNSYWDSLRIEQGDLLRTFPLNVPISGGFVYDKNNKETVLEIRLVIKNFIKKYEYDFYSGGVYKVCHYYAFSDWLRDVHEGDEYIGRNLHAVARVYVPGETGEVKVVPSLSNQYVIMIPADEPITDYSISKTGKDLRDVNKCDIPEAPSYPGSYIESVLDYYLNYEKYKYNWNSKVFEECGDFSKYEEEWNAYEAEVENFKIAPFVAYFDGTDSCTFTNVAPGSYKVYRADKPQYGSLFIDGDFTQIGSTITVASGNVISVNE